MAKLLPANRIRSNGNSGDDSLWPELRFLILLCRHWIQISALYAGLLLTCVTCIIASQTVEAGDFSPQEWAIIKTLSPLPDLPVDTTNKYRDSQAAALLGQKLFFEPRLAGPIQTGTPQEGQLGAIGDKYKIACRNCHMPESKWLFDVRSNNGGPIPNATALGSL
jgi:hypothetical protein